jgi:hypothetical protein
MTWRDHLTDEEQAELEHRERVRDQARADYNGVRSRLKSRVEARLKKERQATDQEAEG